MTNSTIDITLFSPIRPQFWANIGIPYSNFSYFEDMERRFKKLKKKKKNC